MDEFLSYGQKCELCSHSDLLPSEFNQFVLQSNERLCQMRRNLLKASLRCCARKNGVDGQPKNFMPPAKSVADAEA